MRSLDRSVFDCELDTLLEKAESLIPAEILPDLPYMEHVSNVHEWYPFELELWNIGEQIRLLVSERNKKLNANQINRIMNICLNKKAKRGRQSFVMLLGRKKYSDYAELLIPLLNDDDVDGHMIDTLYKMQASGYAALITPFLNHHRTWIRNTAKKYIQKYD